MDMNGLPPELALEQQRLARRQKIADAMLAASQQPLQSQTAGGYVVPISPLAGVAQMVRAAGAAKTQNDIDQGYSDLGRRYNEGLSGAIRDYQATATRDVQEPDTGAMTGTLDSQDAPMRTAQAPNDPRARVAQAMASPYAPIRELGKLDFAASQQDKTNAENRAARAQEAQLARDQRRQDLELRLQDARLSSQDRANLQRELAQMRIDGQRELRTLAAGMRQPVAPVPTTVVKDGKAVVIDARTGGVLGDAPKSKTGAALPPTAVKMQNEMLEDIGLAGSITSDLSALDKQITDGKLKLGPVSNIANTVKNFAGKSDEGSRNYASFKSTLEKLRNDSLRLNKGVQTEGDAQRAWNELIANANDPAVVQQRLKEIQRINQRGADLKRLQLDQLRANYGIDPMDTGAAFNQPPAVGQRGASGTWEGPERRETPRAPAAGRRVVDF